MTEHFYFAAADAGEWIKNLISFAVLFMVFIGGPILKALRESAQKRRESAARGIGSTERKQAEDEARRAWDALMRGENETAARPLEPPPIPRSIVPPASLAPAPTSAPLSTFEATRTEEQAESNFDEAIEETDFDEERMAREMREKELAVERARRQKFLALEQAGAAARTSVAPAELATLDTELETAASTATRIVTHSPARTRVLGAGDVRAAVRQAIVVREVLGPPRALLPFDFQHAG